VIVNRTTGHLVDGHLRAALARERGETMIPVVYVELSDAEERLVLATLDPLGALAEQDGPALTALLDGVSVDDLALRALLDELGASATAPAEVMPPAEFPEYGEDIETEHTCPKCGYAWSGGA
jgi:ParB-like chromosome segregation protein Spo0J